MTIRKHYVQIVCQILEYLRLIYLKNIYIYLRHLKSILIIFNETYNMETLMGNINNRKYYKISWVSKPTLSNKYCSWFHRSFWLCPLLLYHLEQYLNSLIYLQGSHLYYLKSSYTSPKKELGTYHSGLISCPYSCLYNIIFIHNFSSEE